MARLDQRSDGRAIRQMYYNARTIPSSASIAVRDLSTFMLTHGKEFFREQFQAIPENKEATTEVANKKERRNDHHFGVIYPYDHARVHLLENQRKRQGDYINASYVQGYKRDEIFIASQDPTKETLQDFVRMLWEQSVEQVVMLSDLEQNKKMPCERYWPEKDEMDVGEIKVRLTSTQVFADYIIRRLQLCKAGNPVQVLIHFHFTSWSDNDVSIMPWTLVDFEQQTMSYPTKTPIVVHCSSSVGRTGTFIALRNLMREAEDTGQVDFFTTVQRLRMNRMNMVQNAEQYEFLHKAALAAVVCMGTRVTTTDVHRRLKILEQISESGQTKLEMEFTDLCLACDCFRFDTQSDNVGNNKSMYENCMENTTDKHCQVQDRKKGLTAGLHGTEDTTAMFIPSFTCRDHQILTNLPSPSDINDFWRLVIQCNVSLIVAFDENPAIDTSIGEYLPTKANKTAKFSSFDIDAGLVTYGGQTEARQVQITGADLASSSYRNTEQSRKITHLKCKTIDLDPTRFLALAQEIRPYRPEGDGRILYMCRTGASYSDLMCLMLMLLDRMDHDHHLMVPVVVGALKTIRPQAIPTLDQYRLLYEVLGL